MTHLAAKYPFWLPRSLSPATLSALLFIITGLLCLWQCCQAPIGDFGNYYYGSKLWAAGRFSLEDYTSIHHFNAQIRSYGETRFFENYTPVPPVSLLAYLPLTLLAAAPAKLLFNLCGLVLFAFSWRRFLRQLPSVAPWLLLAPLLLYIPLYNNLYQGQTYLLIAAALMEAFVASEKNQTFLAACCLAFAILLKIFPAFLLVYFLLRRHYRTAIYSILLSACGYLLGGWLAGPGILTYYTMEVLPRLFQNDIVGAFYPGNQSLYTLLLDLFVPEPMYNSSVWLHAPWLVPLLEGLVGGFLLAMLFAFRKTPASALFGLTLLVSVLFSRYQTTYGLLLLAPFVPACLGHGNRTRSSWCCVVLIAAALGLPSSRWWDDGSLLRYARFACLMAAFVCYVYGQALFPAWRQLLPLAGLLVALRFWSFQDREIRYFELQNTRGILYDYRVEQDSITMLSTLGEQDVEERFALATTPRPDSSLHIRGNALYAGERLLYSGPDQKRKPMRLNDSTVLVMSDQNQGVGFYKLRCITLKP